MMQGPVLHRFDMNLLVVFHAIMEARSVTRAGDRLGRTQSAVSNALRRLRRELDDPLFIRTRDGLVPTPAAERVAPSVAEILEKAEAIVRKQPAFEPGTSRRTIAIGAPDRLSLPVMQPLVKRMLAEAPQISVSVQTADREYAVELLEAEVIDIGVGWFDELPGHFRASDAFREDLVCLVSEEHPLARAAQPVSLEEVLSYRHLVVTSGGRKRAAFDALLERLGLRREARVTLSNFALVPELLRDTDLVGAFTRRTAQHYARTFGLRVVPMPLDFAPLAHQIVWHARFDNDGMHRWVRGLIAEISREVSADP